MRCRHCDQRIEFDTSSREWTHGNGKLECIIAGADVGTTADPEEGQ